LDTSTLHCGFLKASAVLLFHCGAKCIIISPGVLTLQARISSIGTLYLSGSVSSSQQQHLLLLLLLLLLLSGPSTSSPTVPTLIQGSPTHRGALGLHCERFAFTVRRVEGFHHGHSVFSSPALTSTTTTVLGKQSVHEIFPSPRQGCHQCSRYALLMTGSRQHSTPLPPFFRHCDPAALTHYLCFFVPPHSSISFPICSDWDSMTREALVRSHKNNTPGQKFGPTLPTSH
jgi:hypothetical protein